MNPPNEWADSSEGPAQIELPTGRCTIAVIGLGEVGRVYAMALQAVGHEVRGFDAAPGPVSGVEVTATLEEAVTGADFVLTLTGAAASLSVAEAVVGHIAQDAAYVDFTSSAPNVKRTVEGVFGTRSDVAVADVAILGPVIQHGVQTPLMAAGPAARTTARLMRPLGAGVTVVDGPVGNAMAYKLLRSVFMKGLAAAVTEAVTAGRAAGFEDWIRDQIARELSGDGQRTIDRFLRGSVVHARRRADEMDAAAGYLAALGVDATMSTATAKHLQGLEQP